MSKLSDLHIEQQESGFRHSPIMQRIVIVEEYASAYTLDEHGNLLFTPIGEYNQIYYSSDVHQGGNTYDDWDEVDIKLVGDEYDYDSIIDELTPSRHIKPKADKGALHRLESNKKKAISFFETIAHGELESNGTSNQVLNESDLGLKVIDTEPYHSGGGCLHYFLHLSDKRILSFHHTDDVEVSYDRWESISDYINDHEDGMGREDEKPNYVGSRQWRFPFEILLMP